MKRLISFFLLAAVATLLPGSPAFASGSSPMEPFGSRYDAVKGNVVDKDSVCPLCGQSLIGHDINHRAEELFNSITPSAEISALYRANPPMVKQPVVFSGFRTPLVYDFMPKPLPFTMNARYYADNLHQFAGITYSDPSLLYPEEEGDETLVYNPETNTSVERLALSHILAEMTPEELPDKKSVEIYRPTPEWLIRQIRAQRIFEDLQYKSMIARPSIIQYAYWDLPEPPRLPDEDTSYEAYLRSLNLPTVSVAEAIIPDFQTAKTHWLHSVATALQFSQAYLSSNWYQGGTNYLSLLFNFDWSVNLNTVYHPNLLFNSDLNYKMVLTSNPEGSLHKYSISTDLLQYNLKAGFKAFQKWFYSVNLQLKTPIFNTYPADSPDLKSSFLSPGDFNLGLGMTYANTALNDRLKFALSISPISYNIKSCVSPKIDHEQYGFPQYKKCKNEIGSNSEFTLEWNITDNIYWKSRVFLFTDYKYFQADWENTLNFNINKFLSTQLYIYPRYDSSTDFNKSKWHYWMLKEILSFGLSYTFSTKP